MLLQTDLEPPFDHLDILQMLHILQNLAFHDVNCAEDLSGLLELVDRLHRVVFDADMTRRLLEGAAVGCRQQQDRLLFMPDLSPFWDQHGLVVPDEVDDVIAGDVVGRDDDHALPVKGGIERNGPYAAPGHSRSDRLPVPSARGGDVVGVARAPRHFVDTLATGNGAADGREESGAHVR